MANNIVKRYTKHVFAISEQNRSHVKYFKKNKETPALSPRQARPQILAASIRHMLGCRLWASGQLNAGDGHWAADGRSAWLTGSGG